MMVQKMKNQAVYNHAKQQNNPYESTIVLGKDQRQQKKASAAIERPEYITAVSEPMADRFSRVSESSSSDSERDMSATVVPARPTQAPPGELPTTRRYSADDRPITPMRNQMLYSLMLESPNFTEDIPEDPLLAETIYGQEEFASDDSDDDVIMMRSNLQSVLRGDGTPTDKTLVVDDEVAGAFGPAARDIKIKSLRNDLEKKLGRARVQEAYSYLRSARFDDRRTGAPQIDEAIISRELGKIIPSADDQFKIETLLFLEMQGAS